MENNVQVPVQPGELELIQAKSAAQFALTPIGLQVKQFEMQQRMARMYCSSSMVPANYQGEANLGNCVIAIDMANRMNASVLMVMQNLDIVKGKPSWSSKFLIATINASGKFSPLRFVMVGKPGDDSWGCKCIAYESSDRERKEPLEGTTVTVAMAKKEGWWSKKDRNNQETSKWQSMPEQMLKYRAAAFWQRLYAPEIGMGFLTTEEQEDIDDQTPIYDRVRDEVKMEANKKTITIEPEVPEANEATPAPVEEAKIETKEQEVPLQASADIPDFMK